MTGHSYDQVLSNLMHSLECQQSKISWGNRQLHKYYFRHAEHHLVTNLVHACQSSIRREVCSCTLCLPIWQAQDLLIFSAVIGYSLERYQSADNQDMPAACT